MTEPATITAVTAWPAVAPTDASLVGKVFETTAGNAVNLYGRCTAGAGSLYLLRYDSLLLGWFPVDIDAQDLKALEVDVTLPAGPGAGYFSGTWMTGESGRCAYVVLAVGGPTLAPLRAAQRRL